MQKNGQELIRPSRCRPRRNVLNAMVLASPCPMAYIGGRRNHTALKAPGSSTMENEVDPGRRGGGGMTKSPLKIRTSLIFSSKQRSYSLHPLPSGRTSISVTCASTHTEPQACHGLVSRGLFLTHRLRTSVASVASSGSNSPLLSSSTIAPALISQISPKRRGPCATSAVQYVDREAPTSRVPEHEYLSAQR